MAGHHDRCLRATGVLPAEDFGVLDLDAPIAVKEAVLPFKRFRTADGMVVDTVLGPEMRSTGEVMGLDVDFPTAFRQVPGGGVRRPADEWHGVHLGRRPRQARDRVPDRRLVELGFEILATEGTSQVLRRSGIPSRIVRKFSSGRGPDGEVTIVDLIRAGEVDMVVNTPSGQGARADGYEIRTATTAADKAIVTTVQQLGAAVQGIEAALAGPFAVKSLQQHERRCRRAARGVRVRAPFGARLAAAMDAYGPLCVGIDPHPGLLAAWGLDDDARGVAEFARRVMDAVGGRVAAVKPQSALFERHGSAGVAALEEVVAARPCDGHDRHH